MVRSHLRLVRSDATATLKEIVQAQPTLTDVIHQPHPTRPGWTRVAVVDHGAIIAEGDVRNDRMSEALVSGLRLFYLTPGAESALRPAGREMA